MSQQSLLELSQHRYAAENQKHLLVMADAYFYKKHYLLGPGVDADRRNHAMLFQGLLCQSGCEMVNYIEDKINGRLESVGCKPKKKKLNYLLKDYCDEFNCTEEKALDYVIWGESQW